MKVKRRHVDYVTTSGNHLTYPPFPAIIRVNCYIRLNLNFINIFEVTCYCISLIISLDNETYVDD